MERACELSVSLGKTKVVLDVRESNQKAQEFFRSQGFRENLLISRYSDQILGIGPTIRMEHRITAPTFWNQAIPPSISSTELGKS
jgi:ribosomal protein S18 acetylase RimI-like enzyme